MEAFKSIWRSFLQLITKVPGQCSSQSQNREEDIGLELYSIWWHMKTKEAENFIFFT